MLTIEETSDWDIEMWASSGFRYRIKVRQLFNVEQPPKRLLEEEDGRVQAFYHDGSHRELWGFTEVLNQHCLSVLDYESFDFVLD